MKKMTKKKSSDKRQGQISLIALLLAAGAIVVVMSLVPRTVSEIKLSKQEELAAKALYAAEAGVEQVLGEGVEAVGCDGRREGTFEDAIYNTTVSCLGSGTDTYVFENILGQDEAFQINFDDGRSGIDLKAYWVLSDRLAQEDGASLEFALLCEDAGSYSILRVGLNSSGNGINNFTPSSGSGDVGGVQFSSTGTTVLTCSSVAKALRIKSLIKETTLGLEDLSGLGLPVLEYRIYSEGKVEAENIVQAVEVTRPATAGLSSIFDYAVFSGSSL